MVDSAEPTSVRSRRSSRSAVVWFLGGLAVGVLGILGIPFAREYLQPTEETQEQASRTTSRIIPIRWSSSSMILEAVCRDLGLSEDTTTPLVMSHDETHSIVVAGPRELVDDIVQRITKLDFQAPSGH